VEGIGNPLRFGEPGHPVMANGVSINGENRSETRENVVGRETKWNQEFSCKMKTKKTVVEKGCVREMNDAIESDKDQNA
jgi:hypothetical protein